MSKHRMPKVSCRVLRGSNTIMLVVRWRKRRTE